MATSLSPAAYLSHDDAMRNRPTVGKLRLLGHNIGFTSPISLDVIDHGGKVLAISLTETLERVEAFDGYSGRQTTSENIVACCFVAYHEGLMTGVERDVFESFVCSNIEALGQFEAARRLVHNCQGMAARPESQRS